MGKPKKLYRQSTYSHRMETKYVGKNKVVFLDGGEGWRSGEMWRIDYFTDSAFYGYAKRKDAKAEYVGRIKKAIEDLKQRLKKEGGS